MQDINHDSNYDIKKSYEDILTRKEFFTLRKENNTADVRENEDADIDLSFKNKHLSLHSHQLFTRNMMNPNTPYKRLLAKHSTGSGKCLGKNTPVLLFNGSVKLAQDIQKGDKLMGDDGTPRTVLSTATGQEMLYNVQYPGGNFVCNESHILSLKTDRTHINSYGFEQPAQQYVYDMDILNYNSRILWANKQYYGYRCGVEMKQRDYITPPYVMGLWVAFVAQRGEVQINRDTIDEFDTWARAYIKNKNINNSESNFISIEFQESKIIPHIPSTYLRGSKVQRYEILAGILDGLGKLVNITTHIKSLHYRVDYPHAIKSNVHKHDNWGYRDMSKNNTGMQFYDNLAALVRSIGLVIKFRNHITIHGDFLWNIPTTNTHLEIPARYRKNTNSDPLLLPLIIRKLEVGDYYGFEIDGNRRFLLGDYVCTHNTILALSAANTFIENYKQQYEMAKIRLRVDKRAVAELDQGTPSIFIIGFNHSVFFKTLLEFPEFGYVSVEEKEELDRLRMAASAGMDIDIKRAADYYNSLKRVIIDKRKGGFFKFYGYQMLVNRLFISDDIDLTDIEAVAKVVDKKSKDSVKTSKKNSKGSNPPPLTADDIEEFEIADNFGVEESSETQSNLLIAISKLIEEGRIQINQAFLEQFKDGLLICDEIHNVYNSAQKNNWGVAIQYLLDYHKNLRALFLSATPINNSPTEIIDVLNLLLPAEQKIHKQDFFVNNRNLKPGKLEEIGRLSAGRVSFLEDINPKYYPSRTFAGEKYKLPREINGWKEIPYLKFVKCEMSPLQYQTYINMLDEGVMYSDGYSISDMVFPNPENTNVGLYRSSNTKNKIMAATASWRDKVGINTVRFSALNTIFRGKFLHINNIGKYSAKYHRLIENILKISYKPNGAINTGEKIMIYHERVKMSGVLLIQELLRENGFVGEGSEPTDNTLCSICGEILKGHAAVVKRKKIPPHDYYPARFIMAHGDMDKLTLDRNIAQFNSRENANGVLYKIIVGSSRVKESYEIMSIRHMMIMSLPTNIPALMQILGRSVRKNSHIHVPVSQRHVEVSIYVNTLPKRKSVGGFSIDNMLENISDDEGDIGGITSKTGGVNKPSPIDIGNVGPADSDNSGNSDNDDLTDNDDSTDNDDTTDTIGTTTVARKDLEQYREISYEVYRYFKKLQDYIVIQEIEKVFHEYAIDAEIHRETIMTADTLHKYFPKCGNPSCGPPIADIGALYYEPKFPLEKEAIKPSDLTLTTFNAYGYSQEEMTTIVSIIKRLFLIQPVYTYNELWSLVQNPPFDNEFNSKLFSEGNFAIALSHLIEPPVSIYDKYKKQIITSTQKREITEAQFIAALFDHNEIYIHHNHLRYRIIQVGKYYTLLPVDDSNEVIADIDSFNRTDEYHPDITIDVESYIIGSKSAYNYEAKKDNFYYKYCKTNTMDGFLTEYNTRFYYNLLDEIIIHRVVGGKVSKKTDVLYHYILEALEPYDIVIYLRDVARYKNVARMIRGGIPKLPPKTPMGYLKPDSIKIFDREDWIEIGRGAMNFHTQMRENRHTIGYFDSSADGGMKFKLRDPISKLDMDTKDIRTIPTGMVCETKNKKDLLKIAKDLNVRGYDPRQIKVRQLCMLIQNKLLDLEQKERERGTSVKYVYLFNEKMPTLKNV